MKRIIILLSLLCLPIIGCAYVAENKEVTLLNDAITLINELPQSEKSILIERIRNFQSSISDSRRLYFAEYLLERIGAEEKVYKVISITDGDTFDILDEGKEKTIRLLGVDTPEVGDQGYTEAKQELEKLLTDKEVRLVYDATTPREDKYERTLAYVYLDDLFVNYYMINMGFAREFSLEDYEHMEEFKSAEMEWLTKEPTRRRYCSEFSSCEQAMSALNNGAYQLDGDGDGVPCESDLCD